MELKSNKPVGKRVEGTTRQMTCTACNRVCGIIFETKQPSSKEQQFRCICPCGDKTFILKSNFICSFVASKDIDILDMIDDSNDLVDKTLITLGSKQ